MASHDGSTSIPSPEVRIDVSSNNMRNEKAYQDIRNTTREVHTDASLEDIATNKASRDGNKKPEAVEVHEDMANPMKDYERWQEEKEHRLKVKVSPEAVVHTNCRTLFKTALKGDWKTIEKILIEESATITEAVITADGGDRSFKFTVLDVAIMGGRDELVEKLLQRLSPGRKNFGDRIKLAAKRGRIRMLKALVSKIDDDPKIIEAALVGALELGPTQKELTWYLARRMAADHNTIGSLIMAGHMDVALYLARKRYHPPGSLKEDLKENTVSYLDVLAVMPRYFRSGARLNFWKRSIYKCIPLYLFDTTFGDSIYKKMGRGILGLVFIRRIGELKLRHNCSLEFVKLLHDKMKDEMTTPEILEHLLTKGAILDAASCGVLEIVDLSLKYFPELMWESGFIRKMTAKIVKGRHVELFKLVETHNIAQYYWSIEESDNKSRQHNLFKAVTEWPSGGESPDVSGAAFLLQRELQWFRAVDVGGFCCLKWAKFLEDKKSYWEVFVDKRKDLLKDARDWMKDTSSSCSLVATLIITIAFTAAFTVPGGNNGSTGIPIFLENRLFLVFAITDTLALIFSVSATLMFLAILNSCYEIKDFRDSLPRKIIIGLTFLFLSLVFMLVAFCSALTIVLKERFRWIYILIPLLAAFPVILFAILQLPLYIEMFKSTFWPRLNRPLRPWDGLDITQ